MTSEMNLARIAVILLFAISFTLVGWFSPMMYATYAPDDSIIEGHSFAAQDVNPNDDQHYMCFDRTVRQPTTGQVFTELYLVSDGDPDTRTEIQSNTMERYFQDDRANVVTPLELPENLEEGEYRYLLVIRMDLADGRVERAFTFESEKFTVSEDVTDRPTERPINC